MKKVHLLVAQLYIFAHVQAQFTITPGAEFILNGTEQLTLSNLDFVNNGIFSAGTGTVFLTGDSVNWITGSQSTALYDMNMGKATGMVQLQVPLAVSHQLIFSSGLLDLNANDLNLGSTGSLMGEQESSHIIGPLGGIVIFNTDLDAPSAVNPGNLGVTITSSQNLGNTIIKRGHQSQSNASGVGNSILRYFDIVPSNNTGLNATVRLNYFDAELNGLDENSLVMLEKSGTQNWVDLGFDARDADNNYEEQAGVPTFGRFTLSSETNPLPVQFVSVTAQCNGNAVLLAWQTAQEENSNYFQVEKSQDGNSWTSMGQTTAAGNSNTLRKYTFTDANPAPNDNYRIAEYDLDGKSMLSQIVHASCSGQGVLAIWPNPVENILYMTIPANNSLHANIQLIDARGSLIKQEAVLLANGNNGVTLFVNGIASGVYWLIVTSSDGNRQTRKIIKR